MKNQDIDDPVKSKEEHSRLACSEISYISPTFRGDWAQCASLQVNNRILYKVMNKSEKYTASLNIISGHKTLKHYKTPWYKEEADMDCGNMEDDSRGIYAGDLITIQEFDETLSKTKK